MPLPGVVVRRAVLADIPTLRDLRIQALSDTPAAFGSTLERELARSSDEWARWVSPNATFVLESQWVARGMAAGVRDATDATIIWLMAMWLHPALRRSGAASLLVDAVLGWATSVGAARVRLEVVEGNEAAVRLYDRYGFRPTGHVATRLRDRAVEVQMERPIA